MREPKREPYGLGAVFEDLYGNLWDLLEPNDSNRTAKESPADLYELLKGNAGT